MVSALLGTGAPDALATTIVLELRLPRAVLAATTGAALALAGAVSQGLFRNPLADPSLIGVTGGATLGAALTVGLAAAAGQPVPGSLFLAPGAFAGGVTAVILVYRLATSAGATSMATMLLAGIAVTALSGALVSLMEFMVDDQALRRLSLWKMGGLDGATSGGAAISGSVLVALLLALPRHRHALNALLLGEADAHYLGVSVPRLKVELIAWIALAVGTSVALAGTIAFVGLVVPHMVRLLLGPDHGPLLPASAAAGAVLLLVADILARVAVAPAELPVGILTALLGVPFFIALLRQRSHLGLVAP